MNKKKYVFKPYDSDFPKLFLKESKRIQAANLLSLSIEHVGSTAVEGLRGKGIIDILIKAPKLSLKVVSELLQSIGYEFRKDYSEEDRFFFCIDLPDSKEETRRYHVHLTFSGSKAEQNLVGFRDHLKTYPEARLEYEFIKKSAVEKARGSGEVYRQEKALFFRCNFQKITSLKLS